MKDRRAFPWWRGLICLLIAYLSFEFWAQIRFAQKNIFMPMGIRANMGVDFYDTFKLKPHFRGEAPNGDLFVTDQHGFRIAPNPPTPSQVQAILVGGDSRIFGFSLPWGQGFTPALQKLHGGHVHQQAYPGGSPALFNHEMWELGVFDRLDPKPSILVYDFDRLDGFGDQAYKSQLKQPEWRKGMTRLKRSLGGYGLQRVQTVARGFLKQWKEPWPEGWDMESHIDNLWQEAPAPPPQLTENIPLPPPTTKTELQKQPSEPVPPAHPWLPSGPSRPEWKHGRSHPVDKGELMAMRDACKNVASD